MFITGLRACLFALLVFLGPTISVRESEVRGALGQSVTLPCTYSVREKGVVEMCWGRDWCATLGCSQTLMRTDGRTVILQKSSKYHMDGKIEEGNVSLTVNNLRKEDSGQYCCRVEIAGLFNDQKVIINLVVSEKSNTPAASPSTVFFNTYGGNHFTSRTTEGITGNLNSTFTTSPAEATSLGEKENRTSFNVNLLIWTGVGLGILIFLTGIAIFIFKKKLKVFQKDVSAKSAIGIHIHQAVEENIYNVE
ncbi:hepatitis A virus cellular receptor 1 homolog [Rhincodon typus]|uniref:hepatitis A virus cellular receptor 1 homolog n=1 Tax=Rhincodon typus TaxID=259920 RepID=UPI00202FD6C0|nr:hepatitis A virus cellular receptor 1 homolog [Rhincodon typus]